MDDLTKFSLIVGALMILSGIVLLCIGILIPPVGLIGSVLVGLGIVVIFFIGLLTSSEYLNNKF